MFLPLLGIESTSDSSFLFNICWCVSKHTCIGLVAITGLVDRTLLCLELF